MNYTVKCLDCGNESEEFSYDVIPSEPIQMAREFVICSICESVNKQLVEKE